MADVYKRSVFLQFLILTLAMVATNRVADSMKGHFRRQEYSDRQKHQWPQQENNIQRILNRTLRGHNQHPKPKSEYGKSTENIEAQISSTAILPCGDMPKITDDMINVTMKWFKRNNISRDILTLDDDTLVDDKRFFSSNATDSKNWNLYIRYAKHSDAGLYQCQMCWNETADTCINNNISLRLVEAHAKIFGGPTKIIRKDKELPLRLSCVLINSIEPPEYIFWYHDDRMINYDLEDGATVREGPQGSELIFPKANRTHAGNYSCVPSNAKLDSILVYYGDRTTLTNSQDGSGGKKSQSQDDIVNMLVLISTFQLCR